MAGLIAPEIAAELRSQLRILLPTGRRFPVPASDLAEHLGVSTRTVGGLVADLIERDGVLVGSICSGDNPGYFLCADAVDVEAGTAHLVSRARAMHVRVGKLRELARERFDEETAVRLFNLDEVTTDA